MLKITLPFSLTGFALFAIFTADFLSAGIFGALIEATLCGLLLYKLNSQNEFNYNSIYGRYLESTTMNGSIAIIDIIHIAAARVSAFIISSGILFFAFNMWWLAIPAIVYLLTSLHIV